MPTRTIPFMLRVNTAVEVEPGVLLPPGTYRGVRKETGSDSVSDGRQWIDPQYSILLGAEQLSDMGAKHAANIISVEYDVSKFIRSGEISCV